MSFEHRTNEQVRQVLGQRLRVVRRSRGLTQNELAERSGLSRPTVSTIERGNDVSLDSFLSVLRGLDLLDGLDAAVAEPAISPIGELKRTANRGVREASPAEWVWGDEL